MTIPENFLPSGAYFVGDPGYVIIDDEKWGDFCAKFYLADHDTKTVIINNLSCQAQNTAYGDGLYLDEKGNLYPVDAGLIGATPVKLYNQSTEEPFGCIRFDFDEPFQVLYNNSDDKGLIEFIGLSGKVFLSICTNPQHEDEDEEDELDESEDDEDNSF